MDQWGLFQPAKYLLCCLCAGPPR